MNKSVSPFREAVEQLSRVPMPSEGEPAEMKVLAEAFQLFNDTTQRLEVAHRELEKRVQQVDRELERKNLELAQANRDLQSKIAELDRTRNYLNNLIDSMASGLISVDCEGTVTTCNRAAKQLTGWQDAEMLGENLARFVEDLNRESINACLQAGESQENLELQLCCKGKKRIPVRGAFAPVIDEHEEPQGMIFTFIDQSSVRLLEERVCRQGRLAALGELAAGVAHEMRNPLTTVRGFIQLLPDQSHDPEFRKEFSTHVLYEIDRLTRLTEDLLNLAKPINLEKKPTSVNALLQEVREMYQDQLEEAAVLCELEMLSPEVPVFMDRNRMKQVLINLVLNAIDAMPEGGHLYLRFQLVRERLETSDREDPFAMIQVEDTGCGVPKEHVERLFDPFFTLRDEGTGLGLAVSHRIVEEHQGFIRMETEQGSGTTFSLLLPLSGSSSE